MTALNLDNLAQAIAQVKLHDAHKAGELVVLLNNDDYIDTLKEYHRLIWIGDASGPCGSGPRTVLVTTVLGVEVELVSARFMRWPLPPDTFYLISKEQLEQWKGAGFESRPPGPPGPETG